MKIRLFLALFCFGSSLALSAQQSNEYFEGGPDNAFIKALYSPRYLSATLTSGGNEIFKGSPLRRDLVGIGLYGLGIGLEIYIPSPIKHPTEKEFGQEIDFLDIQGAVFLKKLTFEYSYQYHRGWVNSSSGNTLQSRFFLRETRITPMYIFNGDKFSWKMPVNLSTRQIKSAGSFVLGAEIKFLKIKDDQFPNSSLIFGVTDRIVSDWNGVIIWPGYAHNFVRNNFYLSVGAFAGGGLMSTDAFYIDQQNKGTEMASAVKWRAGVGYNDGAWLISALFQSQHNFMNGSLLDMQFDNQLAKFSVGYRFESSPGMKKLRSKLPILKSF